MPTLQTPFGKDCYVHAYDAHLSFDAYAPTSTRHFLGKCTACKHVVRLAVQQSVALRAEYSAPDKSYIATRTYQHTPLTPGAEYVRAPGGAFVRLPCPRGCIAPYTKATPLYIVCKSVQGHVNEAVPCNSKCTSATGPHCECRCGGANHGGQYAL